MLTYISGLLKKLNITISPLKKELVFICFACRNVFINYNHAKENFEIREKQALNLLLGPVQADNKGLLPFVPYLKRKCLRGLNSEVQLHLVSVHECLAHGYTKKIMQ